MRNLNLSLNEESQEVLVERISRALKYSKKGQCFNEHHKEWAIDQMVRALLGCKMEQKTYKDGWGTPYVLHSQGTSDDYEKFVKSVKSDNYDWNTGIEP